MTEQRKKRRGPRWWALRIAILLVLAAVVLHWPNRVEIKISPATTVITGPLNADGTVNYVAYLDAEAAKGVTPENNLMVGLLEVFGREMLPWETQRALAKLGLSGLPEDGEYFIPFTSGRSGVHPWVAEGDSDGTPAPWAQLERATAASWTEGDFPAVAAWLDYSSAALDKLVVAAGRERLYTPLVAESDPPWAADVLGPSYGMVAQAGDGLAARAMMRLGRGNVEAAWADLMTLRRLGRRLSHDWTWSGWAVGTRLEGTADEGTAAVAGSGKLTPEQAMTMLADMDALPAAGDIVDAVDRVWRLCTLDTIMMMYRGMPFGTVADEHLEGPRSGRRADVDWNEMLRMVNRSYDRRIAAMRKPTFAGRKKAMGQYVTSLWGSAGKTVRLRVEMFFLNLGGWPCRKAYSRRMCELLLIRSMLLRPGELLEPRDQARMKADLARLSLALAAWKAEKGAWPERLAALMPAHLEKIPVDRFSGEPLIYKPGEKGFLLYSVGPNGVDDGGEDDDFGADDIRVEIGPEAKRRRWKTTTRPALSQPAPVLAWETPQGLP